MEKKWQFKAIMLYQYIYVFVSVQSNRHYASDRTVGEKLCVQQSKVTIKCKDNSALRELKQKQIWRKRFLSSWLNEDTEQNRTEQKKFI